MLATAAVLIGGCSPWMAETTDAPVTESPPVSASSSPLPDAGDDGVALLEELLGTTVPASATDVRTGTREGGLDDFVVASFTLPASERDRFVEATGLQGPTERPQSYQGAPRALTEAGLAVPDGEVAWYGSAAGSSPSRTLGVAETPDATTVRVVAVAFET